MANMALRDIGKCILLYFSKVTHALELNPSRRGDADNELPASSDDAQSEKERFQLWAANLGLYAMGDRSLDYRIQDSPSVKEYINQLLDELREDLVEVYDLLTRKQSEDITHSAEGEGYQGEVDTGINQSEETAPPNSDHEEQEELGLHKMDTETQFPSLKCHIGSKSEAIQSLFEDIVDVIDRLYRIAAKLRNSTNRAPPSARNFYRDPYTGRDGKEVFLTKDERDQARVQAEGFHSRRIEEIVRQARLDEAGKPSQEKIEILELEPHAQAFIRRIAIGNAYRQQQFIFWRQKEWERRSAVARQGKAVQDVSEEIPSHQVSKGLLVLVKTSDSDSNVPSRHRGAFSEDPSQTWKLPKENILVPLDETKSLSSRSEQTTTPTTCEPSGRKVGWPLFPKQLMGKKEFLCPYCFVTCPPAYRGKAHWRSHLIQDLQPYTCTANECPDGDSKPLNTWEEWIVHEQIYHRMEYTCADHPTQTFPNKNQYIQHILNLHSDCKDELLKDDVVDKHAQVLLKPNSGCPLCSYEAGSWPDMDMHLAFHLETLALLALPLATGLEEDEEGMASLQLEGGDREGMELLDDDVTGAIVNLFESKVEGLTDRDGNQLFQGHQPTLTTLAGLQQAPEDEDAAVRIWNDATEHSEQTLQGQLDWASITPAAYEGHPSLQEAAESGRADIVDILLREGVDVNVEYRGRTALLAAAERGHADIVDKLLDAGADANLVLFPGGHRYQSFCIVCETEWCLDMHGLVCPECGSNFTEIIEEGHDPRAELLHFRNAKGNTENPSYARIPRKDRVRTALHAAVESEHADIVDKLLNAGAEVNTEATRYTGYTVLQVAAEGRRVDILGRLLRAGADVNAAAAEFNGRTALQAAVGNGRIGIVDKLITMGADVNAAAAKLSGRTALQVAAGNGRIDTVDKLITIGADVNAAAAEFFGRTALQAAAENGRIDIVYKLLKAGADINGAKAAYGGLTALQAADSNGHGALAELLRQAGAAEDLEDADELGEVGETNDANEQEVVESSGATRS